MENYRRFIDPKYSVRQVLVEHQHFNDPEKRAHLQGLFFGLPSKRHSHRKLQRPPSLLQKTGKWS